MDCSSSWYRFLNGAIDYKFDLTKPVPFPLERESVSFFYSSHTLEHIPQQYCQHIFDEIHRCLKPNGVVRITVPDYDLAYEAFKERRVEFFMHNKFEENFRRIEKKEFAEYYISQIPLESQRELGGNHINWWNYDKLEMCLKTAGFGRVYRSEEQSSCFPEMRGKGRSSGFDSTYPEISVFVEAVK